MFDLSPSFICRRCLTKFVFPAERLSEVVQAGSIRCPGCKAVVDDKRGVLTKFFMFYPRFVEAIEKMKSCGVELVGYSITHGDVTGSIWIKSMDFKCGSCGKKYGYTANQLGKFAGEPGLFVCKKCHIQARPLSIMEEFLVSFRSVQRSALQIYTFVWDTLSPLQLSSSDLLIRLPECGKAYPR